MNCDNSKPEETAKDRVRKLKPPEHGRTLSLLTHAINYISG